uniref:C2 domain-containing protein n=1 Tax=Tetradesmus obliquus TaxID=3088 RepID=A0A383V6C0_TETOB|eukprot:jgi/Sobl393_1/11284/SZX60681.1
MVTADQQQPYYILECGNQRSRSKPCLDSGTNPTWNTAHKFNITDEVAVLAVIKDEGTKGIIGQGMIELPRALQYGKDEGAAVLMNMGGEPAGTLRFKLKFSAAPASSTPTAAPGVALAGRPSDPGSQASGRLSAASPRPADAAAAAAVDEDDPMLAAAASKVSLAKQAMQQLTAELAELTGADNAEAASPYSRQAGAQGSSSQERHGSNQRATSLAQQYSHSRAGVRQPRVSAGGSVSPMAAASPTSPSPRGWGQQQQQHHHTPPQQQRSQDMGGWRNSAPVSPEPAAVPSTDELLSMYGAPGAVEQLQLESPMRAGGGSMLVRQLQEALAAAHAEKMATEEELGSVKEAMAEMSKQHYMDVKRYKDAATAAGSAQQQHQQALQQLQEQQAQQQQQQLGSPKGLRHMIDTHPHPQRHPPRVSQDSAGSFDRADKARRVDTTHDGSGELPEEPGSPVPAYKLQIQIHQLERQLAEAAAKTQEEVAKREAMAGKVAELQSTLEAQVAATRQAEANAKAAEAKAASQATLAAAARVEMAAARETSGKEADLSAELSRLRAELAAAAAEKGELEEALGLMEKNNSAQVAALQAELRQAQEEAGALRAGNEDVASLQEQLAAAHEEASGLRNSNEDVDYLQAQLRRTLRDNVELRHQVQMLQQTARQQDDAADAQQAEDHTAFFTEHEALMQELVASKLELAELKEQQVRMQRQLFKAQEGLKNNQI